MNWNTIIEEGTVRALLSGDYARFAGPVREALIVFLSGLPAQAQAQVLATQAALPPTAGPALRLARLAQQCPVLHKLGQTLARDRRLAPALRRELCRLESLPCSLPVATLQQALARELGPLADLGIDLAPEPIAEASVAVVIGYRDRHRDGVFKLLKPGIEERLAVELDLLSRVGAHLDAHCQALDIPPLGYREAFRQVEEKLSDEVRLTIEQRHLALAAAQYAGSTRVRIPALHAYCTPRVTAMERMRGGKVTEHAPGTTAARRQLAFTLASALLAQPLFSTREPALFHGDPHAGNLLLAPDGRIGVLDWSLAGALEPSEREALLQILIGAMLFDAGRIAAMLATLFGGRAADAARLHGLVQRRLRGLRPGRPPEFDWVLGLLDATVAEIGTKVRGELLLLRKTLHILQGLVADIDTDDQAIDQALFVGFMQQLTAEWPLRWLAAPGSRAFGTRLSNIDLAELMLRSPLAVARSWL